MQILGGHTNRVQQNYVPHMKVKNRTEQVGYIISRKSAVRAGGVGVGHNNDQSHQLLSSPLKATDSLMGKWMSLGRFL